MLKLDQIKKFYPQKLHGFDSFIIREYLQYKILEIIYESKYHQNLIFMGGTCLRILHDNQRFSEDIDFDNAGLSQEEFSGVRDTIKKELEFEGYTVEVKMVQKGAYRCYIRFPGLLFSEGLSGHKEQKILIQLDTEPQHFTYKPETSLINKFDVFTEIHSVPLSILLAQKFYAILNRKRNKGRDFFDVTHLISLGVTPDFEYLKHKTGIGDSPTLKEAIINHCRELDMNDMANDVAPFLFNPKDKRKVERFGELIRNKLS